MGRAHLLALAAALVSAAAWGLTVDTGITDYQVVQCDAEGRANISVSGSSDAAGKIEARVVAVQREVMGWNTLGEGASWSGTLEAVPAGGPYRIELRVLDAAGTPVETAAVYEVLVGDLWILAGQSNMQGVGNYDENIESPHPQVHVFAMNHTWCLAKEKLHNLAESPDPIHCNPKNAEERQKQLVGWRDGPKGAGLGLAFAREMVRRTGRPVGLIASAHGGTSMDQWNPALRDEGGNSLYGSMYKQVMAAAGGRVRGVLWYQGESDARKEAVPTFRGKFRGLIEALRKDFNDPALPFFYVQISRFTSQGFDRPSWNTVQTEQLAAESDLEHCAMVPAIDLALDDAIHIGTPGLKVVGRRLAKLAEADCFDGTVLPGPRFASLKRRASPFGAQVCVTFSGVNGGLEAAGRAAGFSITAGPDGEEVSCIFKQDIDPDDPKTVILWMAKEPEDPQLWYGRGLDPYCNVVDAENMAMPVFGPVPLP